MTDEKYTARELEEMADALLAQDKPEKAPNGEKAAKDAKSAEKAVSYTHLDVYKRQL